MKTDSTKKGLEPLIMRHMTGTDESFSGATTVIAENAPIKDREGWFAGHSAAYDREYAVNTEQLFAFLLKTQPDEYAKLAISDYRDKTGMARQKFLARRGERANG